MTAFGKKSNYGIVDFDDILEEVGSFGKYQKLLIFLVFLPALLPDGVLVLNAVFMAATPADHWCQLPMENVTDKESVTNLLPRDLRGGVLTYSKCTMFNANYSSTDYQSIMESANNKSSTKNAQASCRYGYEYDHSVYENTIVTEFDLVCDKSLYAAASFTYFTLGGLFGPLFWGLLADRFGRRFGFFACVSFQSVFSIATPFAPNYVWYCVFRFCVGMTTSASYSLPMLMCVEISGPRARALIAVLCSTAYTCGVLLLGLLAYFVRSWRELGMYSSIPLAVIFVILYFFFPESPRWLLAHGRYDQLEVYLREVAKVNGKKLDAELDTNLSVVLQKITPEESTKNHTILDLFKFPNMRKKTAILVFVNFCNKGVFMGLNYYAPGFGMNPHLNFFLASVIELPPYLFAEFICDRIGRRMSLFLGMLLGSLVGLITAAVPGGSFTLILSLSLVAKFCITFTYLVGELMEDEIFPTVIRGEGHSITSAVSSLAGCVTPFVVQLGHSYLILPLVVYGCCCFSAAFIALFLPETANEDLPQTLEDGERFGKDMGCKDIFRFYVPKPKRTSERHQAVVASEHVELTNGFS
ncbi:beta-alanine transporter-like [Paramacrobiotus metropolitanus]|uniref:beta-alanine transporter-like n=1 Tax=Paramacrobiotus metropolitanus TaxID=2943436 RepID=UPI0024465CF9|nr:beta-alanine transporter-like [Paramacrobiotus metropolitanus]